MNRNIIRMISLLPLFASCGNDGVPELHTEDGATGMSISRVSFAEPDELRTRAGAGDAGTVTEGSIGIFLKDALSGNYSNRDNCRYTSVDGAWKPSNDDNIVSVRVGRPALLWAVYPYHENHTKQTEIPLSPCAFSNAKDVCYGPGTTTDDKYCQGNDRTKIYSDDGATPVPVEFLNMKHAYAWFTFEIKKENYTGTGEISHIRVGNIIGHTTMDITTATATDKATIADGTSTTWQAFTLPLSTKLILPGNGDYVSTTPGNGDMLLVPCALADAGTFGGTTQCGLKVTITADGEEYFAGIPLSVLSELEGGKHYTIQLTLQDMNLSDILVVVSSEWKNAAALPGDDSNGNYGGEVDNKGNIHITDMVTDETTISNDTPAEI